MARASGCSLGSVWLLGFPIPGCNSVPSWCRSGRGLGCVHNQQQHCSMANTYSTTEHQSTAHHAIHKHSFLRGKNLFDQNCFQKLFIMCRSSTVVLPRPHKAPTQLSMASTHNWQSISSSANIFNKHVSPRLNSKLYRNLEVDAVALPASPRSNSIRPDRIFLRMNFVRVS